MSHDAKDAPKDGISYKSILEALVDPLGEVSEGRLAEHAEKGVQRESAKGHTEDEFVCDGGKRKDEKGGNELGGSGAKSGIV